MNLYLSSYKIGNEPETLKRLVAGRTIGFIPNAIDYVDYAALKDSNERNMKDLTDLGIAVEMLDLREYFGKPDALAAKLETLGGVWVRGGNTFVLRQAMRLSGFDDLIKRMPQDFLYGGFSAGVCVLAPDFRGLQQVDDPAILPYPEIREPIWEGLGLLDYLVLPHYKSDHPESAAIDKEVEFCEANGIPYRTLRDGDVMVIEGFEVDR